MNSAQVGVFEEPNKVGFGSFLFSEESGALEPQVALEILGNLTNKAHEGYSADEQIGAFLIAPNLTKAHGARTVPVGLLDAAGGGGGLASTLCGEMLAGQFSSCGLTGGLLGSCHGFVVDVGCRPEKMEVAVNIAMARIAFLLPRSLDSGLT